jgi:hypothetical protein
VMGPTNGCVAVDRIVLSGGEHHSPLQPDAADGGGIAGMVKQSGRRLAAGQSADAAPLDRVGDGDLHAWVADDVNDLLDESAAAAARRRFSLRSIMTP